MADNETQCSPSQVCLSNSDSELLVPTPWSDESKNEKGQKAGEKNSNGKDIYDHVPDEIDDIEGDKDSDASICGKKGNLEFLVCKQVPNRGGDETGGLRKTNVEERVYAD
ncbi:hypothetical protein Tco_0025944 [Tanacetum coccineum]